MGSSADPALTVLAWGNASRGDDAIGPLLAERLRATMPTGLSVIEDHQLNIEHVMDLDSDGAALFIDASVDITEGYRLQRIVPSHDGNFSTHAISPQALLNVFEQTIGQPAPESWLLHVAAQEFELGAAPGEVAKAAIEAADQFLQDLLQRPTDEWRDCLRQASS
ncbi:MAG: hydrogenase maturation protease [Woeseiaceae bacterium]|nr:hydrogenase maturation protease [Woeseiaceae bacterium]